MKSPSTRLGGLVLLMLAGGLLAGPAPATAEDSVGVLMFSKTAGFREHVLGGLLWAAGRLVFRDGFEVGDTAAWIGFVP